MATLDLFVLKEGEGAGVGGGGARKERIFNNAIKQADRRLSRGFVCRYTYLADNSNLFFILFSFISKR